ncbi:hypothetical protein AAY23_103391, partial [Frankia casuarinae]
TPTQAATPTQAIGRDGAGTAGTAQLVNESPTARAATLASLTGMEGAATNAARTDCLRAGGPLASLLASMCAAGTAHAELLALAASRVSG